MDKFGIFKLLTSAYDFYQKTSNKKNGENTAEKKDDFLSSILNFGEKKEEKPIQKPEEITPKTVKPLQQMMLSTISNHEEFVRRVMERNKK